MSRSTHAKAILGEELYSKLKSSKTLVIGAGGIGCELCKSPFESALVPLTYLPVPSEESRAFWIQRHYPVGSGHD
jgi:hypothetical protein